MSSKWREIAARTIQQVIDDNPNLSAGELRKAISNAYPFGQRAHHPYKIWLDEVKRRLSPRKLPTRKECVSDPNQPDLF